MSLGNTWKFLVIGGPKIAGKCIWSSENSRKKSDVLEKVVEFCGAKKCENSVYMTPVVETGDGQYCTSPFYRNFFNSNENK